MADLIRPVAQLPLAIRTTKVVVGIRFTRAKPNVLIEKQNARHENDQA
jgi:hypothetical protein